MQINYEDYLDVYSKFMNGNAQQYILGGIKTDVFIEQVLMWNVKTAVEFTRGLLDLCPKMCGYQPMYVRLVLLKCTAHRQNACKT